MPSKQEEANLDKVPAEGEGLPVYSPAPPAPSAAPPAEAGESTPVPPATEGPTSEDPFNFPSNPVPAPSAETPSFGSKKPVAIPQQDSHHASPFILAYAPVLLSHGITPEAWHSFLNTLSAFLTAKVSARAISHAGEVAKQIGKRPKHIAKGVACNAKDVGTHIGENAKRGNILGAAVGVLSGAVRIPVSAAVGVVRTIVSLPGSTIAAVSAVPATPRERAAAYVAVANSDWFQPRGLFAAILDTEELSKAVGVSAEGFLESAQASKESKELKESKETKETEEAEDSKKSKKSKDSKKSKNSKDGPAEELLRGLQQQIEALEIKEATQLSLGDETLWVVVTQLLTHEG